DRHLHPGAEAPGPGQQYALDVHSRSSSLPAARTLPGMSLPRVVAVAPGSPAARAGILPGDELLALNGEAPRDIIRYRLLADEAVVDLDVRRGGLERAVRVEERAGEPLGAEVNSAVFDRVRT